MINREVTNMTIVTLDNFEKEVMQAETPVVVDFWASWCGWCRAEFPVLKEVYAKYKDQNFELLGIAVNDDREKTLKAMKEDGVTWPQILNTGKVAMEAYGIADLPEIILFAPDGKILACGLRGHQCVEGRYVSLAKGLRQNFGRVEESADRVIFYVIFGVKAFRFLPLWESGGFFPQRYTGRFVCGP